MLPTKTDAVPSRWGKKLIGAVAPGLRSRRHGFVGPRHARPRPLRRLLAVGSCDGAALVLAILRGGLDETLSFAGVLALAVILGGFTGRLTLAAVRTDALHLFGAHALIGARIHSTGDEQHRRRGDQR